MKGKDKVSRIDEIMRKDGLYLSEACSRVGLSPRRYLMIKQKERERKALDFLLSQVSPEIQTQFWDIHKSPGRINFEKKFKQRFLKSPLSSDNKGYE